MADLSKLLSPLGIASGVLGLGKTIFGLTQATKASRELENLQMPQYETPESLTLMGNLARERASATQMPGQQQFEANLDQAMGEGLYGAQKFATSSLSGQQTAENLAAKKMQAIQDFGGQFAEFKAKRQQELMGVMGQEAEDQQLKYKINQYDPYMIKRNELTEKKQAGWQNFFGGVDESLAQLTDLAGTSNYLDILKQMGSTPKPTIGQGVGTADQQRFNNFLNINWDLRNTSK